MSSVLKSSELIKTIRRRAFIPRDQTTFLDDDFLEMATEEINLGLMEQIISARGDYLVVYEDIPLVEGMVEYPIPARSHGNKLRALSLLNQDGEECSDLTQLDLDMVQDLGLSRSSFFIRNNNIVISKSLAGEMKTLRMSFYLRPNKLVQNSRSAVITSIATNVDGSKAVSFQSMPTHFTSNIKYDITGAASPNKIKQYSIAPVSLSSTTNTLTIPANKGADISVGDYVTKAEETVVPNVPTEYHPVIAQRVAVACLEAMGDEQNKQSAERKLAQMEKAVLGIVSNRVEGSPKKIRQRNGTLQAAAFRSRKS